MCPQDLSTNTTPPAPQKRTWTIVWVLGIILVACLSTLTGWAGTYLVFDQISPISEQTLPFPTSSETDQPEMASSEELLEVVEEWELSYEESFNHGVNGWDIGTYDGRLLSSFSEFQDGHFRVEVIAHDGFVSWERPGEFTGLNFYLEVAGRLVEGNHGQYGLIFHYGEGGFYQFVIDPITKEFEVDLRKDEVWQEIYAGELPEPVSRGWNKLAVLSMEETFYFMVNDRVIYSAQDDSLPAGEIGIIYSLDFERSFAIFEFDDLKLIQPKK